MSAEAIKAVFAHTQHSGSALLMLLCIADCANGDGTAWGHMTRFAEKCRMTAGTAGRVLSKLTKSGELEVTREAPWEGLNMHRLKTYRIAIMKGPAQQKAKVKGGAA